MFTKRTLATLCALLMLFSMAGCTQPAAPAPEAEATQTPEAAPAPTAAPAVADPEPAPAPAPEAAASAYVPGTYTAASVGFGGEISVTITVDAEAITDVQIVGDSETKGVGSLAVEKMPAMILDAQSADVDTVAGCTISSNAILSAAAKAIEAAQGVEAAAVAVKMAPGTYTASAYGFASVEPLTVKVTVDETSIVDIVVSPEHSETISILDSAAALLIPRMLEHQSVKIDAICGATASSNAIKTAVEECLEMALAYARTDAKAIENFYTVPPKANEGVVKTMSADVLVIGLGGAGTNAAVSAAEQGLSVIGIDKSGKYGGVSVVTSEPMAINPEKFQEEFNNGEDYLDAEAFRARWLQYTTGADGEQNAKVGLVDMMFDYSGEAFDWLVYNHGFTFGTPRPGFTDQDTFLCRYNYVSNTLAYRELRRTGVQKMFDGMIENYTNMGGQYFLEVEGTELMYDKATNTVTGAYAVGNDGTQYEITAKAVVLATGGFAGNDAMVDQYITQNEYFDYSTTGGWKVYGMTQNDGKMIQAALDIGAATYNISMPPMVHNTANEVLMNVYPIEQIEGKFEGVTGRLATQSLNDVPQIMVQNPRCLLVGNAGTRYANEAQLSGKFGCWENGREYYTIWSSNQIDDIKENGFATVAVSGYTYHGGWPANVAIPEIYEVLDTAVDLGIAYKASSIEDLAKQIGVPADALANTVEAYNGYCAAVVDEEFGKPAEHLQAVEGDVYYCVVGTPYIYATVGGLDVNESLNVLDTEGNEINGLYAAGEDCLGCLMSEENCYVTFGGAAQGWAVTSGYCLGKILGERLG